MFTWSLRCTLSPASAAMTSLAFMFDDVPEPVWKTSIGNWSSCSPRATASAALAIASASFGSSLPSSAFSARGGALDAPEPVDHADGGTVSPEIGKLSTAFFVSPP